MITMVKGVVSMEESRKRLRSIGHCLLPAVLAISVCCGPRTALAPVIQNVSATRNETNVLSVGVNGLVENTIAVRVVYFAVGSQTESTPDFPISSWQVPVLFLGLRADTDYYLALQAVGYNGMSATSAPIYFRTATAPTTLPRFNLRHSEPIGAGYTMVGWINTSTRIHPAVIVDASGQVVWYHEFNDVVIDWQKQPDHTYTAALREGGLSSSGEASAAYQQLDSQGRSIRTLLADSPWPTDSHELRILPNGDALILVYNERIVDLSPLGGRPNAHVHGNLLQRISPHDNVVFAWDAFDHLSIETIDPLIPI